MAEEEEKKTEEVPAAEGVEPEATDKAEAAEEKTVPESELLKAKAESEDFKRKWYLVTAEYENYRKRTAATKQTAYFEGKADILVKILPVADNLELALGVCKDDKTKEGIEMVLKNFLKVLEAEGIEQIDPVGEPFDPTFSEAIMAAPAAEGEEDGVVRQVCRKGYKKGDKVLRFAQVIVAKS